LQRQKAFSVYHEEKMNHNRVVLLRVEPGKPWLRTEFARVVCHAIQLDLVAAN
jgi:hypothetical protein